MRVNYSVLAGFLIFVASAQFFMGTLIAEALYPSYSISGNYISDLGATCTDATSCVIHQPTANIFNASFILLGALVVIGAYLIRRASRTRIFPILLLLTGLGAMGAGIFTEAFGVAHKIASLIALASWGLAGLWAYTIVKSPLRHLSAVLGAIGLVALTLFLANNTLGLGPGGMERMIVYPELMWSLGFGTYLMTPSPESVAVVFTPGSP